MALAADPTDRTGVRLLADCRGCWTRGYRTREKIRVHAPRPLGRRSHSRLGRDRPVTPPDSNRSGVRDHPVDSGSGMPGLAFWRSTVDSQGVGENRLLDLPGPVERYRQLALEQALRTSDTLASITEN